MTQATSADRTAADAASLNSLFSKPSISQALESVSPHCHAAALEFWRVPLSGAHLSPRMKELVLLAMHASAAMLNGDAVKRQVRRALAAGGTPEDIVDVVTTIASLANHSLYASVPILDEEWSAAGKPATN